MRKSILIVTFFGFIALGSLYSGIDIFMNVDDSIERGFILVNYNNIFIINTAN